MDQNGLYDIYSVWHVPFWQTSWFYWAVIGLIILLCIVLVWSVYRWYRLRNRQPITSWEKALHIITKLQKKTYTTQQEGKQCYFVLTTILKQYLEERFAYPIAHKTDEEAASYLEHQQLEPNLKKNVQEILRGCLLIKFANEQAVNEQIQAHLALAKEAVLSTIPQKNDQKTTVQTS
jgi:hypothetical protein